MECYAGDGISQVWIAHDEPATWSYAVGLVLKFLRPHLEKVVKSAQKHKQHSTTVYNNVVFPRENDKLLLCSRPPL